MLTCFTLCGPSCSGWYSRALLTWPVPVSIASCTIVAYYLPSLPLCVESRGASWFSHPPTHTHLPPYTILLHADILLFHDAMILCFLFHLSEKTFHSLHLGDLLILRDSNMTLLAGRLFLAIHDWGRYLSSLLLFTLVNG